MSALSTAIWAELIVRDVEEGKYGRENGDVYAGRVVGSICAHDCRYFWVDTSMTKPKFSFDDELDKVIMAENIEKDAASQLIAAGTRKSTTMVSYRAFHERSMKNAIDARTRFRKLVMQEATKFVEETWTNAIKTSLVKAALKDFDVEAAKKKAMEEVRKRAREIVEEEVKCEQDSNSGTQKQKKTSSIKSEQNSSANPLEVVK